jgi:hypothetical protein
MLANIQVQCHFTAVQNNRTFGQQVDDIQTGPAGLTREQHGEIYLRAMRCLAYVSVLPQCVAQIVRSNPRASARGDLRRNCCSADPATFREDVYWDPAMALANEPAARITPAKYRTLGTTIDSQ